MRRFVAIIMLLGLLVACIPTAEEDPELLSVEQLSEAVSFYPQETGATWRYLPDAALLDDIPLVMQVTGPSVLGGQVMVAERLTGRGIEQVSYKTFEATGVYLHRQSKFGTEIVFEPAMKLFPASSALRVGESWEGEVLSRLYTPAATPQNQRQTLNIRYEVDVVDKRSVTVNVGTFEVFVLNYHLESSNDQGELLESLRQELWFAPYVGEVRIREGYFLVDTNVLEASGD